MKKRFKISMKMAKACDRTMSFATLLVFLFNTLFIDVSAASFSREVSTSIIADIKIPFDLGAIQSSHQGTNGKTIIHIQDAHCNYSCQHSIKGLLEHLNKEHGIDLALLEGGAGDYDLSVLSDIEDVDLREDLADYFARQGRINGAELFAISNPGKITLKGLEDADLYLKNLGAYKDALVDREGAHASIERIEGNLNDLKKSFYSDSMKGFDEKREAYLKKELDLNGYVNYLTGLCDSHKLDIGAYANIARLVETLKDEGKIDFKAANAEREVVIDKITKKVSKLELEALVKKCLEFETGKLDQKTFYKYLFRKAGSIGLKINTDYKELSQYSRYLEKYASFDKVTLFREIDSLEADIAAVLCVSEPERELYALCRGVEIIKELVSAAITRDKYDYYVENKMLLRTADFLSFINRYKKASIDTLALDSCIKKMELFYQLSFKRDQAFLGNIERLAKDEENLVVVSGGFHLENLKQLFQRKGYSYISVMPEFDPESECRYFNLLNGEISQEERAITEAISTLAVRGMFSDLGGDTSKLAVILRKAGELDKPFVLVKRNKDGSLQKIVQAGKDCTWREISTFNVAEVEAVEVILSKNNDIIGMKELTYGAHQVLGDAELKNAYRDPKNITPIAEDSLSSVRHGLIDAGEIGEFIEGKLDVLFRGKKTPDGKVVESRLNKVKGISRSHAGGMGINIRDHDGMDFMERNREILHELVAGTVFGDQAHVHELAEKFVKLLRRCRPTGAEDILIRYIQPEKWKELTLRNDPAKLKNVNDTVAKAVLRLVEGIKKSGVRKILLSGGSAYLCYLLLNEVWDDHSDPLEIYHMNSKKNDEEYTRPVSSDEINAMIVEAAGVKKELQELTPEENARFYALWEDLRRERMLHGLLECGVDLGSSQGEQVIFLEDFAATLGKMNDIIPDLERIGLDVTPSLLVSPTKAGMMENGIIGLTPAEDSDACNYFSRFSMDVGDEVAVDDEIRELNFHQVDDLETIRAYFSRDMNERLDILMNAVRREMDKPEKVYEYPEGDGHENEVPLTLGYNGKAVWEMTESERREVRRDYADEEAVLGAGVERERILNSNDYIYVREPDGTLTPEPVGYSGTWDVRLPKQLKVLTESNVNAAINRLLKSISLTMDKVSNFGEIERGYVRVLERLLEKEIEMPEGDYTKYVSRDAVAYVSNNGTESGKIWVFVRESFLTRDRFKQRRIIEKLLSSEGGAFSSSGVKEKTSRFRRSVPMKPPRVLLFNDVSAKRFGNGIRPPALALASALKKQGIDVDISDFSVTRYIQLKIAKKKGSETELPKLEKELTEILNKNYGIIGLSLYEGDMFMVSKVFVKELRKKTKSLIAVGGPASTLLPEITLTHLPDIDLLMRGECEKAFPGFIKALYENDGVLSDRLIDRLRGLNGLWFRNRNTVFVQNLDRNNMLSQKELNSEYPDFSFFDPATLREHLYFNTSRGCNKSCKFCSRIHGRKIRQLTPEGVMERLLSYQDWLMKQEDKGYQIPPKAWYVDFMDDDFFINPNRAIKILKKLTKLTDDGALKLKILSFQGSLESFITTGRRGKRRVNLSLVNALGKSRHIFVGDSPVVLLGTDAFTDIEIKRLGKGFSGRPYTFHEIKSVVMALDKAGIINGHYIMLTNPWTTYRDLADNLKNIISLAQTCPETFRIGLGTPFFILDQKTDLFKQMQLEGNEQLDELNTMSVKGFEEYEYIVSQNVVSQNLSLFSLNRLSEISNYLLGLNRKYLGHEAEREGDRPLLYGSSSPDVHQTSVNEIYRAIAQTELAAGHPELCVDRSIVPCPDDLSKMEKIPYPMLRACLMSNIGCDMGSAKDILVFVEKAQRQTPLTTDQYEDILHLLDLCIEYSQSDETKDSYREARDHIQYQMGADERKKKSRIYADGPGESESQKILKILEANETLRGLIDYNVIDMTEYSHMVTGGFSEIYRDKRDSAMVLKITKRANKGKANAHNNGIIREAKNLIKLRQALGGDHLPEPVAIGVDREGFFWMKLRGIENGRQVTSDFFKGVSPLDQIDFFMDVTSFLLDMDIEEWQYLDNFKEHIIMNDRREWMLIDLGQAFPGRVPGQAAPEAYFLGTLMEAVILNSPDEDRPIPERELKRSGLKRLIKNMVGDDGKPRTPDTIDGVCHGLSKVRNHFIDRGLTTKRLFSELKDTEGASNIQKLKSTAAFAMRSVKPFILIKKNSEGDFSERVVYRLDTGSRWSRRCYKTEDLEMDLTMIEAVEITVSEDNTILSLRELTHCAHQIIGDSELEEAYRDPDNIISVKQEIIDNVLKLVDEVWCCDSPLAAMMHDKLEDLFRYDAGDEDDRFVKSRINLVKGISRSHAGGMGISIKYAKGMRMRAIEDELLHELVAGTIFGDTIRVHELADMFVKLIRQERFEEAALLLNTSVDNKRIDTIVDAVFDIVGKIRKTKRRTILLSGGSGIIIYLLLKEAWNDPLDPLDIYHVPIPDSRFYVGDDENDTIKDKAKRLTPALESSGIPPEGLEAGDIIYLDDHIDTGAKHTVFKKIFSHLDLNIRFASLCANPKLGRRNILIGTRDPGAYNYIQAMSMDLKDKPYITTVSDRPFHQMGNTYEIMSVLKPAEKMKLEQLVYMVRRRVDRRARVTGIYLGPAPLTFGNAAGKAVWEMTESERREVRRDYADNGNDSNDVYIEKGVPFWLRRFLRDPALRGKYVSGYRDIPVQKPKGRKIYIDPNDTTIFYKLSAPINEFGEMKANRELVVEALTIARLNMEGLTDGMPELLEFGQNYHGAIWMKLKGIADGHDLCYEDVTDIKNCWKGFSLGEKLDSLIKFAEIFARIHKRKIVHNDISSPNLLINGDREVLVIDFNLAKGSGEPGIQGRLGYRAPELIRTNKSDIFSFGKLLENRNIAGISSLLEGQHVTWSGLSSLIEMMTRADASMRKPDNMEKVAGELKRIQAYYEICEKQPLGYQILFDGFHDNVNRIATVLNNLKQGQEFVVFERDIRDDFKRQIIYSKRMDGMISREDTDIFDVKFDHDKIEAAKIVTTESGEIVEFIELTHGAHQVIGDEQFVEAYTEETNIIPLARHEHGPEILQNVLTALRGLGENGSLIADKLEALSKSRETPDGHEVKGSRINLVKGVDRSHAGGMGINIAYHDGMSRDAIENELLHEAIAGTVFGDDVHELAKRAVTALNNERLRKEFRGDWLIKNGTYNIPLLESIIEIAAIAAGKMIDCEIRATISGDFRYLPPGLHDDLDISITVLNGDASDEDVVDQLIKQLEDTFKWYGICFYPPFRRPQREILECPGSGSCIRQYAFIHDGSNEAVDFFVNRNAEDHANQVIGILKSRLVNTTHIMSRSYMAAEYFIGNRKLYNEVLSDFMKLPEEIFMTKWESRLNDLIEKLRRDDPDMAEKITARLSEPVIPWPTKGLEDIQDIFSVRHIGNTAGKAIWEMTEFERREVRRDYADNARQVTGNRGKDVKRKTAEDCILDIIRLPKDYDWEDIKSAEIFNELIGAELTNETDIRGNVFMEVVDDYFYFWKAFEDMGESVKGWKGTIINAGVVDSYLQFAVKYIREGFGPMYRVYRIGDDWNEEDNSWYITMLDESKYKEFIKENLERSVVEYLRDLIKMDENVNWEREDQNGNIPDLTGMEIKKNRGQISINLEKYINYHWYALTHKNRMKEFKGVIVKSGVVGSYFQFTVVWSNEECGELTYTYRIGNERTSVKVVGKAEHKRVSIWAITRLKNADVGLSFDETGPPDDVDVSYPGGIGKRYRVIDVKIEGENLRVKVRERKTGQERQLLYESPTHGPPSEDQMDSIGKAVQDQWNHGMMVEEILELFPKDTPLYVFNELYGDQFGFASSRKNLIALHKKVKDDPVALFHEIMHYLIGDDPDEPGLVQLEYAHEPGEGRYFIEILGRQNTDSQFETIGYVWLSIGTRAFIEKEKWNDNWYEDTHYLLRAMQVELFGVEDETLTLKIRDREDELPREYIYYVDEDEKYAVEPIGFSGSWSVHVDSECRDVNDLLAMDVQWSFDDKNVRLSPRGRSDVLNVYVNRLAKSISTVFREIGMADKVDRGNIRVIKDINDSEKYMPKGEYSVFSGDKVVIYTSSCGDAKLASVFVSENYFKLDSRQTQREVLTSMCHGTGPIEVQPENDGELYSPDTGPAEKAVEKRNPRVLIFNSLMDLDKRGDGFGIYPSSFALADDLKKNGVDVKISYFNTLDYFSCLDKAQSTTGAKERESLVDMAREYEEKLSAELDGGYDVIAFTLHQGSDANIIGITKWFMQQLREKTDALFAVGGPLPTIMPEHVTSHLYDVNILLRGDGEKAFAKIVNAIHDNDRCMTDDLRSRLLDIDGCWIRLGDDYFINNIDSRHILTREEYKDIEPDFSMLGFEDVKRGLRLMTARGCPRACSFCSRVHGDSVRMWDAQKVVDTMLAYQSRLEELALEAEASGEKLPEEAYYILFQDDDFFIKPDRGIEIIRRLRARKAAGELKLDIRAIQTSITSLTRVLPTGERIPNMEVINCINECRNVFFPLGPVVQIGTDAFSNAEIRRLKSRTNAEAYTFHDVEKVVNALRRADIRNVNYVIWTNPWTGYDDIIDTLTNVLTFEECSWAHAEYEPFLVVGSPNPSVAMTQTIDMYKRLLREGYDHERLYSDPCISICSSWWLGGFPEYDMLDKVVMVPFSIGFYDPDSPLAEDSQNDTKMGEYLEKIRAIGRSKNGAKRRASFYKYLAYFRLLKYFDGEKPFFSFNTCPDDHEMTFEVFRDLLLMHVGEDIDLDTRKIIIYYWKGLREALSSSELIELAKTLEICKEQSPNKEIMSIYRKAMKRVRTVLKCRSEEFFKVDEYEFPEGWCRASGLEPSDIKEKAVQLKGNFTDASKTPCIVGMVVKGRPGSDADAFMEAQFGKEMEVVARRTGRNVQLKRGIMEYDLDDITYIVYVDDGTDAPENIWRIRRFKERIELAQDAMRKKLGEDNSVSVKDRTFVWVLQMNNRLRAGHALYLEDICHMAALDGDYLPISWQMSVGPLFANYIVSRKSEDLNEEGRIRAIVDSIVTSVAIMTSQDKDDLDGKLGEYLRIMSVNKLDWFFNGNTLTLVLPKIKPVGDYIVECRRADEAIRLSM